MRGFLLFNHISEHIQLVHEGKLRPGIDPTEFIGLDGIADTIDRMNVKQNIGKTCRQAHLSIVFTHPVVDVFI
uniref:Uncharacterized protein n=1 Tax=Globisporangium ultimum (strain ATCC 200006 / CBS 805.95 / DAOM BR144) TaxID=431595 RepID=K3WRS7_GLOUD